MGIYMYMHMYMYIYVCMYVESLLTLIKMVAASQWNVIICIKCSNILDTKPENVSREVFLTIYLKMVRQGDGLLRASKPYTGAWLLCLVGSSYPIMFL